MLVRLARAGLVEMGSAETRRPRTSPPTIETKKVSLNLRPFRSVKIRDMKSDLFCNMVMLFIYAYYLKNYVLAIQLPFGEILRSELKKLV